MYASPRTFGTRRASQCKHVDSQVFCILIFKKPLSFLCLNSPYFYLQSLQLVQLLWIQPRNQDFEPAACIFYKEVVLFSNQVPILAVTYLDQADANLLSNARFTRWHLHIIIYRVLRVLKPCMKNET